MKRKRKIGMALSSGGARGMAHLGVMTALKEAGLEVDVVAGASIGALTGIGIATDRLESMTRFALELDWKKALSYFVEPRLPTSGLIGGGRIMDFIGTYCGSRKIEELDIPFAAVATDLARGAEVTLDAGPAAEAVRASIAIPGLFTPVRLRKMFLVDGGLVNPLPVDVARRLGADLVIAVDVAHFDPLTTDQVVGKPPAKKGTAEKKPAWRDKAVHPFLAQVMEAVEAWEQKHKATPQPKLLEIMGLSMRIMESRLVDLRLAREPADFLIRPTLGNIFFLDFHKSPEIVERGYLAGREAVPELMKIISDQ